MTRDDVPLDTPSYGPSPLRAAYRCWWVAEQIREARAEYLRKAARPPEREDVADEPLIVEVPTP